MKKELEHGFLMNCYVCGHNQFIDYDELAPSLGANPNHTPLLICDKCTKIVHKENPKTTKDLMIFLNKLKSQQVN